MKFTDLNLDPKILQAIEACGYDTPTPIQSKAIPNILAGKDVVGSAQTGTGKTAAYVLPGLQLLLTKKTSGKPRILILAPTRELAIQITKVIGQYGKFSKINIASFIGGVPYHRQLKELSRPIDIIIATPGRLMDHMDNKRLDLSHIEMLVVDEADRMLDMGFIDDIKTIVQVTPKNRQTLLFSATTDDKLMSIMKNLLKDPVKINISQEKVDTNLIKQKIHIVGDTNHKDRLLEQIIDSENIFKAVIFSATKRHASKLALQLRDSGYSASPMHGDLKQNVRTKTLGQFRTGEIQFLIATDVAARGIDVTDISHVINYDLPKFSEDYVHRIGRTGRAGKTGIAISLALRSEIHQLRKIERYIGDNIQQVQMTPEGEKEAPRSIEESGSGARRRQPQQRGYRSNSGESRGRSGSEPRSYFHAARSEGSRERRSVEPRSYNSAKSGESRGRRSTGNTEQRPYLATNAGESRKRRGDEQPISYSSTKSGESRERRSSTEQRPYRASSRPGESRGNYRSAKPGEFRERRSTDNTEQKPYRTSAGESHERRSNEPTRSYRTAKQGESRERRSTGNTEQKPYRASSRSGESRGNYRSAKPGESRERFGAKRAYTQSKSGPKR